VNSGSPDRLGDPALPDVSVVVPVHNAAATLRRAVDSALRQHGVRVHVIVVDDHSTDLGLQALPRDEPRVTVLRCEGNGPATARNAGIRAARGEFLAFLDADDYWLPGFLSAVTRLLRDYPELGAASTAYLVDGGIHHRRVPSLRAETTSRLARGELPEFLATYVKLSHACMGSVCLRRGMLAPDDLMREDLLTGEDTEFWVYLASRLRWGYVPEALAVYDTSDHESRSDTDDPTRLPDPASWRRRLDNTVRQGDRHTIDLLCARMARFQARWLMLRGHPREARQLLLGHPLCPGVLGRDLTRALVSLPYPFWRDASRLGGVLRASSVRARRLSAALRDGRR